MPQRKMTTCNSCTILLENHSYSIPVLQKQTNRYQPEFSHGGAAVPDITSFFLQAFRVGTAGIPSLAWDVGTRRKPRKLAINCETLLDSSAKQY